MTQATNPRRRRNALTLIEVLLAMVILATGAIVLLTAVSRCLAVVRIARNYHTARNIFDLGELEHPILQKKDEIFNLELSPVEYPNGFTFSRTVEECDFQKGLYIVHTRVSWSDRGNNTGEETLSYLYYTNELGTP